METLTGKEAYRDTEEGVQNAAMVLAQHVPCPAIQFHGSIQGLQVNFYSGCRCCAWMRWLNSYPNVSRGICHRLQQCCRQPSKPLQACQLAEQCTTGQQWQECWSELLTCPTSRECLSRDTAVCLSSSSCSQVYVHCHSKRQRIYMGIR